MIWLFFLLVAVLVAAGFAALITRRITFGPLPEPVHTAQPATQQAPVVVPVAP